MFFTSTFHQAWRRSRSSSHKRNFKQPVHGTALEEEMQIRQAHSDAMQEVQKVKRNDFLERRSFW